jgi:hypothetical protein
VSVLTIIQEVCDRLSLTRPSVVYTSTDQNVIQLRGLLTEAAVALARRPERGWQALQAEWSFVTVNAQVQTNAPLPPDFYAFVPNSFFNRSTMRPVWGPYTPAQWQLLQARPALSTVYLGYRERAGQFLIGPAPNAGDTIAYEYVSSYWAKSSAAQPKATFTADDDGTYLDEELLKLDLKWRYKQAKGLDYGEDMETAERAIQKALAEDGGSGELSISGPGAWPPDSRLNVPETGFGV